MEEYLLSQLDTPVVLKDGTMMTKPDGSPMTKQEAIATNILNLAMNRRSSESRRELVHDLPSRDRGRPKVNRQWRSICSRSWIRRWC